jgi:CHAD domain-containing protein
VESRCETYLDDRDQRLARAGYALACCGDSPRVHVRLQRTDESAPEAWLGAFEVERLPRFVWDLPRDQAVPLSDVLEARALEPLWRLETTGSRWAVLDEERKTIAWIEDERQELRPLAPGFSAPLLEHRLLVREVRGYDEECGSILDRLGATAGLEPSRPPSVPAKLRPIERRPGRWAPLAHGVRAHAGLARIVRSQLEVLKANAEGLRANRDAEYLHDTRVALRRLRSLLGQLKGVLRADVQGELCEELRWLAASTGAARDLDTLLFELRLCPSELALDLGPLEPVLVAERERLQAELVQAFDSPRARELLRRIRASFSPRASAPRGDRALAPFAELLAKRLWRRLRQVRSLLKDLRSTSPSEELHELRIACKKLRYLLECCRGLVPPATLEVCARPLKELQSALGVVQDVEVHAAMIRALALGPAANVGPAAHLALGRFLECDQRRGAEARARHDALTVTTLSPPIEEQFEALRAALEAGEREAS